jgi:hypothetical protein
MAERKSSSVVPEEKRVGVDDIAHNNVSSTVTILTAPSGDIATVHLGWIITVGPMNSDDEEFIVDEDGVIGDEDMLDLRDGSVVLSQGCMERDFVAIEADPTAVRGYANSLATNALIEYANHKTRHRADDRPSEESRQATSSTTTATPSALRNTQPPPNKDEPKD